MYGKPTTGIWPTTVATEYRSKRRAHISAAVSFSEVSGCRKRMVVYIALWFDLAQLFFYYKENNSKSEKAKLLGGSLLQPVEQVWRKVIHK